MIRPRPAVPHAVHDHVVRRSCGAVADVDRSVGDPPCLTASDDDGFVIDEAEVVHRGRCPDCSPTDPGRTSK